jgi:hypothetical protein
MLVCITIDITGSNGASPTYPALSLSLSSHSVAGKGFASVSSGGGGGVGGEANSNNSRKGRVFGPIILFHELLRTCVDCVSTVFEVCILFMYFYM